MAGSPPPTVRWEKPLKVDPAAKTSGDSYAYDTPPTPSAKAPSLSATAERAARMAGLGTRSKEAPKPPAAALVIKSTEPYAIYFCADEMTPFVGAGKAGLDAYKQKYKKSSPGTIFDNGITHKAMTDAGIKRWFLVNDAAENAELFRKYGALANTIVICAPNGEPLAVFRCNECKQSTIVQFCKRFKENAGVLKPAL